MTGNQPVIFYFRNIISWAIFDNKKSNLAKKIIIVSRKLPIINKLFIR